VTEKGLVIISVPRAPLLQNFAIL